MRVPRWALHTPARTHTPTHTRTPTHTHTRSSIARALWCRPALRRTNPVAWRLLRSFSVSAAAQVGPQRVGVACWALHVGRCMLHVGHCMLHVGHFMLHVGCCMFLVACCTRHLACCMLPLLADDHHVRSGGRQADGESKAQPLLQWLLGSHEASMARRSHLASHTLGRPLPHTRLGSPLPHLHRDRAHPCHICTGTGR